MGGNRYPPLKHFDRFSQPASIRLVICLYPGLAAFAPVSDANYQWYKNRKTTDHRDYDTSKSAVVHNVLLKRQQPILIFV